MQKRVLFVIFLFFLLIIGAISFALAAETSSTEEKGLFQKIGIWFKSLFNKNVQLSPGDSCGSACAFGEICIDGACEITGSECDNEGETKTCSEVGETDDCGEVVCAGGIWMDSCGCNEGCTDKDAANYDSEADKPCSLDTSNDCCEFYGCDVDDTIDSPYDAWIYWLKNDSIASKKTAYCSESKDGYYTYSCDLATIKLGDKTISWKEPVFTKCEDGTRCMENASSGLGKGENGVYCEGCSNTIALTDMDGIQVFLDPKYVQDIEKPIEEGGRGFKPVETEVTPYDNIIIEIKIKKPCPNKLAPDNLDFNSQITLNNGQVLINGGNLAFIKVTAADDPEKTETDEYVYYWWKIQGWPDGIVEASDKMDNIIKGVNAGLSPKLYIEKNEISDKQNIVMSNCVHLYGSDNALNKIGSLREDNFISGSSRYSSKELIEKTIFIKETGFDAIDPFKTYKNKFAFYVDLFPVENIGESFEASIEKTTKSYRQSCLHTINILFINSNNFPAWTTFKGKNIIINPSYNFTANDYPEISLGAIVLHEFGHARGMLLDEREEVNIPGPDSSLPQGLMLALGRNKPTNCVGKEDIEHYRIGAWYYGSNDYINCYFNNWHRPTSNSLMKGGVQGDELPPQEKFDVISCGYLAKAITGSQLSAEEYWWNKCYKEMDVIKDGVHLA